MMSTASGFNFMIFITPVRKAIKNGLYKFVPGRLRVMAAGCKEGAGEPVKAPARSLPVNPGGVKILPLFFL